LSIEANEESREPEKREARVNAHERLHNQSIDLSLSFPDGP